MKTYNIYRNLIWLNDLPANEAESLFVSISGSDVWAREIVRQRPFTMLERLFEAAEQTWFGLPVAARIRAFGQANFDLNRNGRAKSGKSSEKAFDNAAKLYKEKFGFIFVLASDGRSASEMAAVCRARLGNSAATELQIAAEEHCKLIEHRLTQLLEK